MEILIGILVVWMLYYVLKYVLIGLFNIIPYLFGICVLAILGGVCYAVGLVVTSVA